MPDDTMGAKYARDPLDLPLMLNVALAAKVSGYGPFRIRELCKAGRIPHIRWGRAYQIPRDAFFAAIQREAESVCK